MTKKQRNLFADVESGGLDPALFCGVNNSSSLEDIIDFIAAPCEKVLSRGDSWIVLGRDRMSTRESGYGGRGDSGSFSVDIVVGRTPPNYGADSEFRFTNPNFLLDAARFFISQKTNLDEYFHLGPEYQEERGKSGIGLKADTVRVVSRHSVRLVSSSGDVNSSGGKIRKKFGVELVVGGEEEKMQPMVLGDNLKSAIDNTLQIIDQLGTIVADFAQIYVAHLQKESVHLHYSPFMGLPTTPSEIAVLSSAETSAEILLKISANISQLKANIAKTKMNYLSASGASSICSPLNKTN